MAYSAGQSEEMLLKEVERLEHLLIQDHPTDHGAATQAEQLALRQTVSYLASLVLTLRNCPGPQPQMRIPRCLVTLEPIHDQHAPLTAIPEGIRELELAKSTERRAKEPLLGMSLHAMQAITRNGERDFASLLVRPLLADPICELSFTWAETRKIYHALFSVAWKAIALDPESSLHTELGVMLRSFCHATSFLLLCPWSGWASQFGTESVLDHRDDTNRRQNVWSWHMAIYVPLRPPHVVGVRPSKLRAHPDVPLPHFQLHVFLRSVVLEFIAVHCVAPVECYTTGGVNIVPNEPLVLPLGKPRCTQADHHRLKKWMQELGLAKPEPEPEPDAGSGSGHAQSGQGGVAIRRGPV